MDCLRKRLAREEGFTLIELLVVIVIIGILMAIAVPSYLSFRDRANQKAADADIRSAVPSVEAYYADCGTYANATCGTKTETFDAPYLKANYDSGMDIDTLKGTGTAYCIDKTVNNDMAHWSGPGGSIIEGSVCP